MGCLPRQGPLRSPLLLRKFQRMTSATCSTARASNFCRQIAAGLVLSLSGYRTRVASDPSCLGSMLSRESGKRVMTFKCLPVSAAIYLCAVIVQPAIIAGVTLGVTLLGVTIIKKSTGKSDEELKEDVKDAANQVKATGRDVWGFTKDKAGEVRAHEIS